MQVHVPDGRLHAVAFGAGKRNFLGHGAGPAGWEAWLLPLQGLSADGWRAASYDHRGSGSSVFPADVITARNLVDDVFRVMDALDFDTCVLGGESKVDGLGRGDARGTGASRADRGSGALHSAARGARTAAVGRVGA